MAGPRRLWALVRSLPPESATFRSERLPPSEEFLARLIEQQDSWSHASLMLSAGKKVAVPGRVEIVRPDDPPPKPKIETDPRAIAAWFTKHVRGG